MLNRRGKARGPAVYAAAAAAVVVILAGGAWLVRAGGTAPLGADPGTGGTDPHWEVLPRAFPVDHGWLSGPLLILPGSAGCFVAFGQDNTGTGIRPGYWRSTDDCRAAENITPIHQPIGDALPSYDHGLILAALSRPDEACVVAWRSTATGWSNEPLGCHGVPTSLAVLAGGTVAGVHWSTLFLRDPVSPTPP